MRGPTQARWYTLYWGRHVRLRGVPAPQPQPLEDTYDGHTYVFLHDALDKAQRVEVRLPSGAAYPSTREAAFSGRLVAEATCDCGADPRLLVDTTASRWTPQTIAGLVVATMGVLVFVVSLRHWLERRRSAGASGGP